MTRLYPRVWQPGLERVLEAGRRMTDGPDSSALDGEGASPWESEKLGVSLFPGGGEEAERPGYCVLRAHMLLEEMVSPLRTGRWESCCAGERGREEAGFWPRETWGEVLALSGRVCWRAGGVAAECFVKVAHPPYNGRDRSSILLAGFLCVFFSQGALGQARAVSQAPALKRLKWG